jgi:hypothetical protein
VELVRGKADRRSGHDRRRGVPDRRLPPRGGGRRASDREGREPRTNAFLEWLNNVRSKTGGTGGAD